MSDTLDLHIYLGGEEITEHFDLAENQPVVISALNDELDTCSLVIKDADALGLRGWEELIIQNGTKKIFGGYIQMPAMRADTNLSKNACDASASDLGAYLDKVYIQKEFEGLTDKEILTQVYALCPQLSAYDFEMYVTAIRTIPRVVFNLKSVRDVLNWLCAQSGGYWYVDYDKKLHYFSSAQSVAPFGITNSLLDSANAPAENVVINLDAVGIVNVCELLGGEALSANGTYPSTQSGYDTRLYLNKRLKPWDSESQIIVRRNDGGATTNLVVNPSFEVNITDGWTQYQAGSGAVWALDTSKYASGVKSLKITAGTAVAVMQGQSIVLAPGETLTVQAKVWSAVEATAAVVIWDVGNAVNRGESYNRKTSEWELVTAGYYNDGNASKTLRVELYNNANDSATVCYYDAVQAEKLQWPSAFCDGSLGSGYAWTGTANNSTSTRVNMPVWTTLTVKTGNIDTLEARDEVLYYESDGMLEQETFWPTLINGVEVDGRESTPVHVIVRNYASIEHFKSVMGGTGEFRSVIVDGSIVDMSVARMRCATELAQNAMTHETIRMDVRKPGLRAGQTINIHLPQRGINGEYLINRVTTTIGVGGHIISSIEVGTIDSKLIDLLRALSLASSLGSNEFDSDEVINQILDLADAVTLSEDEATVSESSGPYLWGSFNWGYGVWG